MSDFERQIKRRRGRERDVRMADRAVGSFIAWFVVGMIVLVLALLVFDSTALVIVGGAIVAVAILWQLLVRAQRK
jgi:hypothetical protein